MATKRAFRKCLPGDRNSCVNCNDYLTCPLAVDGSKGSWVCDDWKMVRQKKPQNQSSVLSLAISEIWPAGIFMNFYRISAHREHNPGTFLLIMMKCCDIATRLSQLFSYTVTVPGTIFAVLLPGLIAYILYINKVRTHI